MLAFYTRKTAYNASANPGGNSWLTILYCYVFPHRLYFVEKSAIESLHLTDCASEQDCTYKIVSNRYFRFIDNVQNILLDAFDCRILGVQQLLSAWLGSKAWNCDFLLIRQGVVQVSLLVVERIWKLLLVFGDVAELMLDVVNDLGITRLVFLQAKLCESPPHVGVHH